MLFVFTWIFSICFRVYSFSYSLLLQSDDKCVFAFKDNIWHTCDSSQVSQVFFYQTEFAIARYKDRKNNVRRSKWLRSSSIVMVPFSD